jgi:sugar phosphate isomerase/epimerase
MTHVRVTRRDLGRLVIGAARNRVASDHFTNSAGRRMAPDRPDSTLEISLAMPDSFGIMDMPMDDILTRSSSLGVTAVELAFHTIEAYLDRPIEPVLLHPPAVTFEMGVLPGEEEIYQEAGELARRTFAARVRDWRRCVTLAPLEALQRHAAAIGVRVAAVRWDSLATRDCGDPNPDRNSDEMHEDELEYACRVAAALQARALVMPLFQDGPSRVAAAAQRHGVTVAFLNAPTTSASALARMLEESPSTRAAIDVGQWIADGHGSPLPFIERHARRIAQVRLTDRRVSDGAPTWFGEGDAGIDEVLRAARDRGWQCEATVAIDYDLATDVDQTAEITRALDYCRAQLARRPASNF